ncbi:DeoR/GlpR family DNA-binding transcription regulator [Paenibacillus sepulcri]|uniref:DeoR/GlpR family DNA-binding transcription regulator n=1 Tax=Paenibacillus sepulcri TaxID=359917 RepID=A0ABS7C7L9_9BACL|nr:DeoR/GlpR family DNA-binding transcription regulator [Paenibacillus sepulcri]
MKTRTRHTEIIGILKHEPFKTIEELCSELSVSPATVRRDLTILEQSGDIVRINGGAIYKKKAEDGRLDEKKPPLPFLNEKIRIAKAAAELVKDGDTIFMDAGSTNRQIAEHLVGKTNITVITNSLEIAYKLHSVKDKKDVSVVICGGTLGETNMDSIVGPVAEKMISMFRANICFIGTSGIDIKQGVTDAYLSTARIKENMIEHSNKVHLVADHSKFGVITAAFVCSIDKIGHIITDNSAPEEDVRTLRSRGILVTLV